MKKITNPPNRFLSFDYEYEDGSVPKAELEIYEDRSKSILSRNDSPDLMFRWSLNPYRGCSHACAYCYARPTHEYLGFGAGTDFETKIVVKKNAPELLREAFLKKSWKGEMVVFSGDTDCYQPVEAEYQLTRRCLEVCLEFGNPCGIITKSFLCTRDIDLLRRLHERTHFWATVSIPFLDERKARIVEPGAASVEKRFEAVRLLSAEGIDVSINIAPVIPGLNDADIPGILRRAKKEGAKHANYVILRLPGSVKEVFLGRIRSAFPLAEERIERRIRESRGGKLYNSEFGQRYAGEGNYWKSIENIFYLWCLKLQLNLPEPPRSRPPFRRPSLQAELFT